MDLAGQGALVEVVLRGDDSPVEARFSQSHYVGFLFDDFREDFVVLVIQTDVFQEVVYIPSQETLTVRSFVVGIVSVVFVIIDGCYVT